MASVVIPTWNEETRITRAVLSVRDQRPDVEVIVVDDHSTDRTVEVASALPGVRVLTSAGQGIIGALTTGLAAARSDIIVRVDADDWHLPGSLDILIEPLLADPELDLVGGSADYETEDGLWIDHYTMLPTTDHHRVVAMVACPAEHTAVAYRRSTVDRLGGYQAGENTVQAEDYDLWIRMLGAGCRWSGTDRVIAIHTVRTRSVTVRHYGEQHGRGQIIRNRWRATHAPEETTWANLRRLGLELRASGASTRAIDMYSFVLGRLVQLSLRDRQPRRALTVAAVGFSLGPVTFVRGMWRLGAGGLRQRKVRGLYDRKSVLRIFLGK